MRSSLSPKNTSFLRHIQRCHNATFPNGRIPFYYRTAHIGWVDTHLLLSCQDWPHADLLTITPHHLSLTDGTALRIFSQYLAEQDAYLPFHEWFDVTTPDGQVIGQIDRGLIPRLGLEAAGVHLNGLVEKEDTLFLWVAKRSAHKRLDPGKLDHLVAGGMSSGLSPNETIIKEAGEEAAIPPELACKARHVSTLRYAMSRPEGLRRDRLYCYDLFLPEDFQPHAADGEVESFHLKPLREVFQCVREEDQFKFNVNLVLIDLFIRYQLFVDRDKEILSKALYHSLSDVSE